MKILIQFLKFGVVGIVNTLINFCVYYFLIYLNVHYLIAYTFAFVVSTFNAYYWNKKYVFHKGDSNSLKYLIKVYVSYAFVFVFSSIALIIMVQYLKISEVFAPVLNLLITIPINFLLNKFWAFK